MVFTRRNFMVKSAAGITGAAGVGSALILQPSLTSAQGNARRQVRDEVTDEIVRQAKEGALIATQTVRSGEGCRRVASSLRVHAKQARSQNIDIAVRRVVRNNRQQMLQAQVDPEMIVEEMKQYKVPPHLIGRIQLDIKARGVLLDRVSASYTKFVEELAGKLESQSVDLDKSGVLPVADNRQAGIRPAQYQAWEICPILKNQEQHLVFLGTLWCSPLLIWSSNPILLMECVFLQAALASTYGQMYWYGC